jgi:hypothetical protein
VLGLLEARAASAGFFLLQLSQVVGLVALKLLPVLQPVNVTADMARTAITKYVVRRRLVRMANASFR